MTKFLVLYRAEKSAAEQMMQATPEQQRATMDQWTQWATKAGSAIVDLGAPLAPVTAGEGDWIGGFSILQADPTSPTRSSGRVRQHRLTSIC